MAMSDGALQGACALLANDFLDLAMHTFGNYVCSKLATRAVAQPFLLNAFRGHIGTLLRHPQGSRVVQATIVALTDDGARSIVAELEGRVLECSLDTHGSWGVCAAFKRTHAPFILAETAASLPQLMTHRDGVRVAQQVLNEAASNNLSIDAAAAALPNGREIASLAVHPYANYALQVVLRHVGEPARKRLLAQLLPHLWTLAADKHGSNVAELLLAGASAAQLDAARAQIFSTPPPPPACANYAASSERLLWLMSSMYGNYVMQALLRRLPDSHLRRSAVAEVEAHTNDSNFGRAILAAASASA